MTNRKEPADGNEIDTAMEAWLDEYIKPAIDAAPRDMVTRARWMASAMATVFGMMGARGRDIFALVEIASMITRNTLTLQQFEGGHPEHACNECKEENAPN